jgi:hypothetical protein
MLTAYFDESETMNASPRHFVVSGYVSNEKGWTMFKRAWWHALVCDGFNKHGLHWTDLVSGNDKFAALGGSAKSKQRERLQRKYLSIIERSSIAGIYAAFDIAHFERVLPTLSKVRQTKRLQMPYFHAFEMAIGRMCAVLRDSEFLEPNEQIAFVFDRKKEVQGKAQEIFSAIKENNTVWYAKHLGTLAFEDMATTIPLQASDALANEVKRHLGRGSHDERWQFAKLRGQVHDFVFTGEKFDQFAERLEERIAQYLALHPEDEADSDD